MKAIHIGIVFVFGAALFGSTFALAARLGPVPEAARTAAPSGKLSAKAPSAAEEEPPVAAATNRAGRVVAAADGGVYTVELGDEVVSPGSILQVYRRMPAARGSAEYRSAVVWWEVGQLTVTAVGGRTAVASGQVAPQTPLPPELDESGAPPGVVLIGDRVRATGGIGPRPATVRVTFSRSDLFEHGQSDFGTEGSAFFKGWLKGLKSMEGPIQVEIYPSIDGLPERTAARLNGNGGRDRDYPIGPSSDRRVAESDDLFESTVAGSQVPESRELLVVNSYDGNADTWHFVDPVRLAQRQADRLAGALAASLRIPSKRIAVRVVPQALSTGGEGHDVPGYESETEQVRILASAIEYVQPDIEVPQKRRGLAPKRRRPAQKKPGTKAPVVPKEQDTTPRRRRLLERPPEVSSKEVKGSSDSDES